VSRANCGKLPQGDYLGGSMSQSIRVSDDLYNIAAKEAEVLHRSIPLQIEHWADIGRALEASGIDVADIKEILTARKRGGDLIMALVKRDVQERSREQVRGGEKKQRDLFLISKSKAKKAVIHYKP